MRSDVYSAALATCLRAAMDSAGVSSAELGRRIGRSGASVSNYLTGKNLAGLVSLCDIALALGIEPGGLLPTLDQLRAGQKDAALLRAVSTLEEMGFHDQAQAVRAELGERP